MKENENNTLHSKAGALERGNRLDLDKQEVA